MTDKKFAFLLMGDYDPIMHQAMFETASKTTCIFTVRDFEQAKNKVLELKEEGFGALELCGAFGPERAKELFELLGGTVSVGYVTHDPAQDALFAAFFGR